MDTHICEALDTNCAMVARVCEKYLTEDIDKVFRRKRCATPPIKLNFEREAEAKLIALVCSQLPEDYARRTIRFLADRVVEMEVGDQPQINRNRMAYPN